MTQARLRELFDYNPETGDLIRKEPKPGPNGRPGSILKTMDSSGYYQVMVDGWVEMTHRVIYCWWHGYVPENSIDHIDMNKINNKIDNLREVSHQCNMRNKGLVASNKSGVTGVRWVRQYNKWIARIRNPARNESATLGWFDDPIEAVLHRFAAEQCLGWHRCQTNSSAYVLLKEQGIIRG